MGWPDLLSKRTVNMRAMIDNLYVADELSSLDPCCQCDSSLPFGYSQLHTLAQRSRRPRDGNLQSDEDMATIVTPTTPAKIPTGPITRDRAHQLNYRVLSFLGNVSNVHVNRILPNGNVFRLLINEGPSMDKKDEHWSMFKHEDDEDITVMAMTINSFIFYQEMKSIQKGMIVCCTRSSRHFGSREDRDQVPHVMDPDSDC